ncbi:efflux RND transporter periplasmic adaptor subunit [Vibrio sp. WXL103]|uniref:efflux RND transporter periplasmic adaptor subunit n=1 Tax=unclassified Vibrio TaxID=2614977 RepID=UPI003EC55DA5
MKKIAFFSVIIALGGWGAHYLNSSEPEPINNKFRIFTVDTTIVERGTLDRSIHIVGNSFAHKSISITPKNRGRISQVLVKSGEHVKKGQLLFALDDRYERAEVKREQANLSDVEQNYNKLVKLLPNGAVTKAVVDAAFARLEMQQAELEIALVNLKDTQITAPFDGRLGLVDISVGQRVENSTELTTLDDADQLRLNVAIPASYLPYLRLGNTTTLSHVESLTPITAKLDSLDGRVSSQTQNIQAQFSIDNQTAKLTPGSLMTGELPLAALDVVTIPIQSVIYRGPNRYVYVIEDEVARQRQVTLGERNGEIVEVRSGLELGEEIVYRGTVKLRDGASVEVQETVQPDLTAQG